MRVKKRLNTYKYLYGMGALIARVRAGFMDGFYSVHVKIRSLHDKTYQKGGWYKRYSDNKYSSTLHKTMLSAFVLSFAFFSIIQSVFPYLFNVGRPNTVQAGSTTRKWTTVQDFTNNDGATGAITTNGKAILSGDGKVVDPGDANDNDNVTIYSTYTKAYSPGANQTFVVPSDVTTVYFAAYGAGGGGGDDGCSYNNPCSGPNGGHGGASSVSMVYTSWALNFIAEGGGGGGGGYQDQSGYNGHDGAISFPPSYPPGASFEVLVHSVSRLGGQGACSSASCGGNGGKGAILAGNLTVLPGQTLTINVGSGGLSYGTGAENGYLFIRYASAYPVAGSNSSTVPPATLGGIEAGNVGLRVDTGTVTKSKAASVTWNGTTTSSGQKLLFKVRVGDTQAELDANNCYGPTSADSGCADWTTAGKFFSQIYGQSNSGTGVVNTVPSKRYIEVLVRLDSGGAATSVLKDITLAYDTLESPSNANLILTNGSTNLKNSTGTLITGGMAGAWSSSTTMRITANSLTCSSCGTATTNLRPEVEVKPVSGAGSTFTGTGTVIASPGNVYVDVPNLTPGIGYHLRVRAVDDQGRVSGWTTYGANAESAADFTIDLSAPSGTVTVSGPNINGEYAKSRDITLTLAASDTGGSNLSGMRFSNDGTNWSEWENYATTKSWTLAAGDDGARKVYAQFNDNAGNVSGAKHTFTADFTGTLGGGLSKTGDEIKLYTDPSVFYTLSAPFTPSLSVAASGSDDLTVNSAPFTIPDATQVRITWTANQSDVYESATIMVGGINRIGCDTGSCNGSVRTTDWINGDTVGVSVYSEWGYHVDASVLSIDYKISKFASTAPLNQYSKIIDYGTTVTPLSVTWSDSVPGGTSLVAAVRASNNADASGGMDWTTVSKGQMLTGLTGWNNYRYFEYRFTFVTDAGGTLTPVLYDVTVSSAAFDTILLDTIPPANVTGLKAYTNSGKTTELTSGNWYIGNSVYYEWTAGGDSDLAGYKYCLGADANCTPTTLISSANYTIAPALSTDGMKYFRLAAADNAGNLSPVVATFNYGYDPNPPDHVTGFRATMTDITKVTLNWNAYVDTGAPVDNYKLERVKYMEYLDHSFTLSADWSAGDGYASFIFSPSTNSFVEFPGVPESGQVAIEASVKYIYRIRVNDIAKPDYSSPQDSPVFGMTQDGKAPDDVSGVEATACDGTAPNCFDTGNKGFEIKVTWSPSVDTGSGVLRYNIYRALSGASEPSSYTKIGETASPGLVFYDNDALHAGVPSERLNDYTTYYYRVTATDASENLNESNLLPALDPTSNSDAARTPDVTAPKTPISVVSTPVGLDPSGSRQRVTVTWDIELPEDPKSRSTEAGSGVKEYSIFRSDSLNGSYAEVGTVLAGSEFTYNDDNLEEFTNYYYKMTATDNYLNETGLSEAGTVRTASNSVPTVPANVIVNSKKGNPVSDPEVGHKVSLTYQGAYSKNCLASIRCIVKYEVYRSSTNWANTADWLDPAKATLIKEENVANIFDDRDTTYTADDTGLTDATTYFYRVRAIDNTPATPDGGPFASGLSVVSVGTLHIGWDVTPDVEKPLIPANGLDVVVRNTHPNTVEYRNIITWVMISGDNRGSRREQPYENPANCELVKTVSGSRYCSDFLRYELHREVLEPTGETVLSDTKITDVSSIGENYYIDKMSLALGSLRYRYYIRIYDNAGTNFKYMNGTVINPSYSNFTDKQYASDTITPEKAKPLLTGNINLVSVGVSSAEISWSTDQDADSLVQFKPKADTDGDFVAIGQIERTTSHTVKLFGLNPLTEYEYQIVSRNYLGNNIEYDSATLPKLTTTGFSITPGAVVPTTTTTEINWVTNLNASSAFIEYQLQRNPGDEPQSGVAGASPEVLATSPRNHKVILKGLRSNRTYTYKIKSISSDGYLSEYPVGSFATFKTKSFDTDQFTLSPASSNLAERNITSTSAQIVWQTGNPTTSYVDYGTTSGVYDNRRGSGDLNTYHVVVLDGLIPGTKYYYRVQVKDANEVEFTSPEYSFTAILKPKISDLRLTDVTSYSIVISWVTNIETETIINWGKTADYGEKKGSTLKTKNHMLKIDNLDDNTEYHYQILARDAAGEEVADSDKIVRTPLDLTGPKISDVKTDILPLNESSNTASVIISWKTDKPATTLLQYDSGLIGTNLSKSTIEDPSLTNAHTVIIKDLDPSTTYRYRIISKDRRGNTTTSNDYNFITPAAEKSILQLILKSLEETFSWVGNIGQFFRNLGRKTK